MSETRLQGELPACPHKPIRYTGPSRDEVLSLRQRHLAPAIFHYYKRPIQIVEGYMQYLWDETGKRYLDAIAGVATVTVGHCHPRIVEALREHLRKASRRPLPCHQRAASDLLHKLGLRIERPRDDDGPPPHRAV